MAWRTFWKTGIVRSSVFSSYRSGTPRGCVILWRWMNDLQLQAAYTSATGLPAGRVVRLPGGAGNRIYWRVQGPDGKSAVVMELPADPVKSEEASKHHVHEELPFLNVHRYLERIGVRVPLLFLDASEDGFLVIEDLTDRTLEQALKEGMDRRKLYSDAIDRLASLRAHAEKNPDPSGLAWTRAFDFDLYQWEFEHFIEYGLLARGAKPTEAELGALRQTFKRISEELAAAPRGLTHRDYQSRNI